MSCREIAALIPSLRPIHLPVRGGKYPGALKCRREFARASGDAKLNLRARESREQIILRVNAALHDMEETRKFIAILIASGELYWCADRKSYHMAYHQIEFWNAGAMRKIINRHWDAESDQMRPQPNNEPGAQYRPTWL
jgi:hypothetical protein